MKTLEMNQANASLAEYTRAMKKEPMIITRSGTPIAALVPFGKADWESFRLSVNPKFIALIRRSRKRQAKQGGLTTAEVRKRLGLK